MSDIIVAEAKRRFKSCAKYERSLDKDRIKEAIYSAGSFWDRNPTAEQIIAALDAAGFKIVRKPRQNAA